MAEVAIIISNVLEVRGGVYPHCYICDNYKVNCCYVLMLGAVFSFKQSLYSREEYGSI